MCYEVQELEDYCRLKHADLDQELHLSPGGLKVLWPFIRSDDFHLVFTRGRALPDCTGPQASYDDDVPEGSKK